MACGLNVVWIFFNAFFLRYVWHNIFCPFISATYHALSLLWSYKAFESKLSFKKCVLIPKTTHFVKSFSFSIRVSHKSFCNDEKQTKKETEQEKVFDIFFTDDFHQLGSSGPSHRVDMSVCLSGCLSVCAIGCIFFYASHWPSGNITSSRPLIGPPSLPPLETLKLWNLESW